MRSFLRPLWPATDTHLLLGRPAGAPVSALPVDGVATARLSSAGDPAAAELEAFAERQGFPEAWAHEMLAGGAEAVVARDAATGMTLAMGWATNRSFHVEEVEATVEPEAGGVYFFGDFVAPAARGHGLQRRLVAERLRAHDDAPYAFTLVHPSNAASVRSYENAGFAVAAAFTRSRCLGKEWVRCRPRRVGVGVAFKAIATNRILVRRV